MPKEFILTRIHNTKLQKQILWTQYNIVNSPYKDVEVPNVTVPEYIWRNLDKCADSTAVVCGITNRSFTYTQLHEYSRNFAATLRANFQIKDGDVVGIMMSNALEYPIAAIGVMQAGAVLTTINPIHTSSEVHGQLLLADPKIIITSSEIVNVVQEAIRMTETKITIVVIKNLDDDLPPEAKSFVELINDNKVDKNVLNDVRTEPGDVVLLPFSSGTTGLPKGVELTTRNIVVNFAQREIKDLRLCGEMNSQCQDSVLAVLPFYNMYGLLIILFHNLSIGAKIVILPKFQPISFLNTLTIHKINLLYVVPPLALFLGTDPKAKKEHLCSVDKIVCAGAPIAKSDIQRIMEKCQPDSKFIHFYGLTEASPVVTCTVPGSRDYTSVGFAVPNSQLRVVDSNEQNLGPDEIGELHIRGPHIMKGYRHNPEATKATITRDGWLRSGDLVSISYDGVVTIIDRIKELIKVKGYQVPPAELEGILREHPDILDAAVIGIPDDKKGEVPKAFVVLKEGHTTTATNIIEFINENVAEYKKIQHVEFLETLPRNPSGKILRRVLKNRK